MVGIIQTDADELADAPDARADAQAGRQFRKATDIEIAKTLQSLRQEHGAGDIGNDRGQIAKRPFAVEQRGFFTTFLADTQQFHSSILPRLSQAAQPPSMM
jgi:hypothetical protein